MSLNRGWKWNKIWKFWSKFLKKVDVRQMGENEIFENIAAQRSLLWGLSWEIPPDNIGGTFSSTREGLGRSKIKKKLKKNIEDFLRYDVMMSRRYVRTDIRSDLHIWTRGCHGWHGRGLTAAPGGFATAKHACFSLISFERWMETPSRKMDGNSVSKLHLPAPFVISVCKLRLSAPCQLCSVCQLRLTDPFVSSAC